VGASCVCNSAAKLRHSGERVTLATMRQRRGCTNARSQVDRRSSQSNGGVSHSNYPVRKRVNM